MKNILSFCLLALSATHLLTSPARGAEDWGAYQDPVQVEFGPDGRNLILLREFRYTGPRPAAVLWKAKRESVVDGASIPPPFWPIIGSPLVGLYRDASVLHDVACDEKNRPWEEVHLMFYHAMRCSGVSIAKAKTMYWAVYHFGPRWRAPNTVQRIFGASGREVEASRDSGGARSRWSTGREEWTRSAREPRIVVHSEESPTPPPAADPARISPEDLARFERWVADENPSLTELKNKTP